VREGVGSVGRQRAIEIGRLLGRGEGLLPPPQIGEANR
jgi:hypothetical protein